MKLAAIAAAVLIAGVSKASEPIADRTCIFTDAALICAHVFEADLILDSQEAPLGTPVGSGFARIGYVDSYSGEYVTVLQTHYTDRFLTSYPYPRTLLLVPNDEWISTGGFEGEYAHPMR